MVSPPNSPGRPVTPRVTRMVSPRVPSPRSKEGAPAKPRTSRPRAGVRPPVAPSQSPLPRYSSCQEERRCGVENSSAHPQSRAPPISAEFSDAKGKKAKPEASRVRVFVRVRPTVRKDEKATSDADSGSNTSAIHCQGSKLWLIETGEVSHECPGPKPLVVRAPPQPGLSTIAGQNYQGGAQRHSSAVRVRRLSFSGLVPGRCLSDDVRRD